MLKYYLRGLGIGIVVTTIILTIVFNIRGKLSDSEIKERASKLGMVMAQTTEDCRGYGRRNHRQADAETNTDADRFRKGNY